YNINNMNEKRKESIKWIRLTGGSMRPSLKHGDIVAVSEGSYYSAGDIAVYRIGDALYMHRIISKKGRSYYFRDDSNISR
ncbi:S24/S26 family peptidase, partial [Elusimicrobiota bacterium]